MHRLLRLGQVMKVGFFLASLSFFFLVFFLVSHMLYNQHAPYTLFSFPVTKSVFLLLPLFLSGFPSGGPSRGKRQRRRKRGRNRQINL